MWLQLFRCCPSLLAHLLCGVLDWVLLRSLSRWDQRDGPAHLQPPASGPQAQVWEQACQQRSREVRVQPREGKHQPQHGSQTCSLLNVSTWFLSVGFYKPFSAVGLQQHHSCVVASSSRHLNDITSLVFMQAATMTLYSPFLAKRTRSGIYGNI